MCELRGERMDTARMSAKGQITIPVAVRRRLGLQAGEKIIFMEKSGNVFITAENEVGSSAGFLSKDKRRAILRSLYRSINDPALVEPAEIEFESPKEWELMDQ